MDFIVREREGNFLLLPFTPSVDRVVRVIKSLSGVWFLSSYVVREREGNFLLLPFTPSVGWTDLVEN